jgi:putative DNA primase/helicase
MSTWNAKAHHYFGVSTRKDSCSGKKENLKSLVCCHADVDFGPDRSHKNRENALAAIESFHIPPSAVVDTGNGFHCYWFLNEPLAVDGNLIRVEAVNKGIGKALKGDPVGDASRILRIPGTWNVKDPANPKPVKLVWCELGRRYALEEFVDYEILTSTTNDKPNPPAQLVSYGDIGGTRYGRAALTNEIARLSQARDGSHFRNIQLNKAAYALGRLVGGGHLDRDIVEVHLHQTGLNIGLPEREIQSTLRSGLEAGIMKPRYP